MQNVLRWWVLLCIRTYQRWISPHKGFRCAEGARTGESCSCVGLRIVQSQPPRLWLPLMREQFQRCALAAGTSAARRRRKEKKKDRDCDCAEAACDCSRLDGDCIALSLRAIATKTGRFRRK